MVDEFQDTNTTQGDIPSHLAQRHRNVLVVGDDAQSIYSFRGAVPPEHLRSHSFPGCRMIKLEENYRSTQAILDVGNAILDNMAHRYEKCLRAVRKENGGKPHLIYFRDGYEEASWVAERMKQLLRRGHGAVPPVHPVPVCNP